MGCNFRRDRKLGNRAALLLFKIKPGIEQEQKDPLRPAKVLAIRGRQTTIPVVREAEHLQLASEVGDVLFGANTRRRVGSNRILLGRQTERVVSHRMENGFATHSPISRLNIRRRVTLRVSDVQSRATGIREHVEDIDFVTLWHFRCTKRFIYLPIRLPLGFDDGRIVTGHLRDRSLRGTVLRLPK